MKRFFQVRLSKNSTTLFQNDSNQFLIIFSRTFFQSSKVKANYNFIFNHFNSKKLNATEIIKKKKVPFLDIKPIKLSAGNGGNGCTSFRREKFISQGPPNGGDGGKGGDIYITAQANGRFNLAQIRYANNAQNGENGQGRGKQGKSGKDLIIYVPLGTVVREYNEEKKIPGNILVDLNINNQTFLAARGGVGGRGNKHFVTKYLKAPKKSEEGKLGERKVLLLELKSIANVGLVGFPNAGKSSLLAAVSNSTPKIAPYPFTTLHPNLGVIEYDDLEVKLTMADLPGIIEGAHENRGLGFQFLRHIERTQILCFVIDMSGSERDPLDDFNDLCKELQLYNPALLQRKSLIVGNKIDIRSSAKNIKRFQEQLGKPIIPLSAKLGKNIEEFKQKLISVWNE